MSLLTESFMAMERRLHAGISEHDTDEDGRPIARQFSTAIFAGMDVDTVEFGDAVEWWINRQMEAVLHLANDPDAETPNPLELLKTGVVAGMIWGWEIRDTQSKES